MRRHVAGDHDHRDRVERRVGDAGRGVGEAGGEVRQQHRGLVRRPRVAVRRVRGDLLVPRVDELDLPALRQRGQHGDVGVAAEAEDVLDASRLEILHQLVGNQVLHCWLLRASGRRHCRPRAAVNWFGSVVAGGRLRAGGGGGGGVDRHGAARRSGIAIGNFPRHRPLDPHALLLLLPRVREDADGARQDEQPAPQLRLEAQLAEDDGGDAVDVHRDVAPLDRLQRGLDRVADRRPASADGARCLRLRHQREQRRGARVDRVEAVAEARHDLVADGDAAADDLLGRRDEVAVGAGGRVDLAVELHALLARAAVDVVEHVDRGGHRAVDRQAAGHRHLRDGDRRRVRAVVDAGHHRRLEQVALRARRQLAAQHQPDHVGKADVADQLLDRIAADGDLAGVDVDDRRVPPRAAVGDQLFRCLGWHGVSSGRGVWRVRQSRAGQVVIVSTSASSAGS